MKLNQINNRLGDFHIDIENLVDHFFGGATSGAWCPRASLSETENAYSLVLEMAGVAAEDVTIEMQDGKLEVSGEKKLEPEVEGVKLIRSERMTGEFRRAFDFDTQVDADQIKADFRNGLLTITLPKSAKVLPRKIEIRTAE